MAEPATVLVLDDEGNINDLVASELRFAGRRTLRAGSRRARRWNRPWTVRPLVNAGRVVTRVQILDHVWQDDFAGESAIIESFISTLRRTVDAAEPKLIHSGRGVGHAVREP